MEDLHDLLGYIAVILHELTVMVESDELEGLRIEKEEKDILRKLKRDVEHRNWRAVKRDLASAKIAERKSLRLKTHELKELHSRFLELIRLMRKTEIVSITDEDLTKRKKKKHYKDLSEYYFVNIYKLARAYERIFRHLIRKEKILARA